MTHHLLIVEDDELVQSLLAAYLQKEGYQVSLAGNGKEMHALLNSETIHLVLLDLNLPDEDGLVLARQIRTRSTVPIIVITARKDRADRLTALEMGADDYVTKPFDLQELILRLQNVLGRSGQGANQGSAGPPADRIRFDGWIIDVTARTVTDPASAEVPLTRSEFNLLAALAKAPNRVLTRDYLLDAVSKDDDAPSERMIDVLISRLRKKIEVNPRKPVRIVTVVGCGYKFSSGHN